MSTSDIAEFFGWLFTAWSTGFCAGYLMTQYKRGIDAVS